MKKIVSIILAALMIMSVATAFAADVTYPENLASYANKEDTKQSSNIKCDTTGATVTVVEGETHSTFGEPTAIFDGVGMASTTDGTELPNPIDTSVGNKKWRWFSYNTSTPAIKIEFPKALTFNKIVYTEARKRITGYTLTFKNNGEEVGTYKNAFTDSDTDSKGRNALYLRSIDIGEAVTADEVVFKVDSAPDIVSICEMEFTNGSITLDNASSILYTSGSQKVESMMDGITYQADGKPLNPADRIVINGGNYPKITVEFAEDITFDTIKHAEVRQMIQKYTVTASKDGAEVFEEEFAFDDGNNTTNLNTTWIRSMSMGESVTADTVVIEVTELTNDTNVISIAEIEFWTTISPVTIKAEDETDIPGFQSSAIANVANGAYDNKPAENNNTNRFRFVAYDSANDYNVMYELPYTIEVDLGAEETFNYAELSELRCLFGAIEVWTSSDKEDWTLRGTMPKMTYEGNLYQEFVHSVSFNPVTARYVRYVIKEIADYNDIKGGNKAATAHINEVAVCNYIGEDAVKIYPIRTFGENSTSLVYEYIKNEETITEPYRTVNASVLINNDTNADKNYKILAAEYTAGGVLLSVNVKDVTVPKNTSRAENLTLVLDAKAEAQTCKVSYMVWDGETLAPYCQAEVGPYQN